MKKLVSLMLSAILLCNMFTLISVGETVDNTGATKLAQRINSMFPDSCTLNGNVITLNENLRDVSEPLLIEAGGEIILDLNENSISADDCITAVKVCEGAKLTVKGDGKINGGNLDRKSISGQGSTAIENYGEIIIENGRINGGNGRKTAAEDLNFSVYGGIGIENFGSADLRGGRINGGNGLTYGGSAVVNYGNLVAQNTYISSGTGEYKGILDEEYVEAAFYNRGTAMMSDCSGDSVYNTGNITVNNECSIDYIENTNNSEAVINSVYMSASNGRPAIVNDGKMTINGGNITGGYSDSENDDGVHAIVNTRTLKIYGGEIAGGEPITQTGNAGAGIYVGLASLTELYGGVIRGGGGCENPAPGIIDNGNLVIYKGFVIGGLASDGEAFAKAVDGKFMSFNALSGSNNDYEYHIFDKSSDYYYETDYRYLKCEEITTAVTLASIINYQQPDSCYFDDDTVYLKTDVILSRNVNITGAEPCTLDLCGYTVTIKGHRAGSAFSVQCNSVVTICNGSIITESINDSSYSGFDETPTGIYNYSKLKLINCTIKGGNTLGYDNYGAAGVLNHNTGILEIDNCNIYGGNGEKVGESAVNNNGGVVTIKSGNFYSGSAVSENGFTSRDAVLNYKGTVTIKSGKFVGGTYRDVICPAIESDFDIPEGTYLQESDNDIIYTKVTETNKKQYLQVLNPNAATKLADVIEEYSSNSCYVNGDTVNIIKTAVIDDILTIPADGKVSLNIENLSCKGIYVPQNTTLYLEGDGEITGETYAVLNDGILYIRNGVYKGGIINHSSLTVYGGEVYGKEGKSAVSSDGDELVLYGGALAGNNAPAISGRITGGASIKESSDGISYTLITAPEPDSSYIYTENGTEAEALSVKINLQQPNSCYYYMSEDFQWDKVVFNADCDVINIDGENTVVDFNGHTFDEISVSGRDIVFTGECKVNYFIENHDNLIIDRFAQINGIIKNYKSVITEGNICGGIYNVHNAEVIVDGGTVDGSAENSGSAICNENFDSRIIINKGMVKGADNVENSSAIKLVLREGEFNGQLEINGGAVIGGTGNAIIADIIRKPGGSSGGGENRPGVSAETDTVYAYISGGILVGGEGKSALSGCIEVDNGVTLKVSDDGEGYSDLSTNKTAARYIKAENSDYIGITSIQLNENYYNIEAGDHININAIFNPEEATNKEILWTSSDESVVTVKDGVVSGVVPGRVTVTATTVDGLKQASCIVNVVKVSSGGVGNLGGDSDVYYNIFTGNIEHNGTTAEFDLELKTNDKVKGKIYIGVYENDILMNCVVFNAQEKHISIDCKDNQQIRLYWWDDKLCPLSTVGYIAF